MFKETVALYQKILHLRFQPAFLSNPPETLNRISPNSVWRRLLKIMLYTAGRLVPNLFKPAPKTENLQGKIWLYVVSQNNYEALHFFKENLPETVFVAGQNKQIGRYNKQVKRLSLRWKLIYTLKFLPVWFGLYKLQGKAAVRFFDLIFVSIGFYEAYVYHLKKHKPRCIVLTNDHNDDSRAMLFAAQALKIPTVYIQHATVSTAFPPLEFDLSLLEGRDALDKYRQCGTIFGKIELIGMPKADKFLQFRNFKPKAETIGICSNLLDDYEGLKATITNLAVKFPELNFIFRPHPNDLRDYSFIEKTGLQVSLSNASEESAFAFLQKTDVIIAADSSILLEAVLLNISGIYFRFGPGNFQHDYYGYVEHGLVPEAKTQGDLYLQISALKRNRPEVYLKAAYYNATLGTPWEGRSHELAINHLLAFLAARPTVNPSSTC